MTSMEQIELISVEARKRGMKYGEYVEKYGHTLPKPEAKKTKRKTGYIEGDGKRGHRPRVKCFCIMCGETFMAGRKGSQFCPECTRKRASAVTMRCIKKKKERENEKVQKQESNP